MTARLAKPVLAGVCAASCLLLMTRSEGWLKLTALSTGVLTGVYALDKLSGNSLDDIWAGGVHLFKELTYQVPMASDNAASIKITRQEDLLKFLEEGTVNQADLTTLNFWTSDRAKRSAICLGQKGSGKTKIQEFRFQQRLNAGVHSMVSDIHYEAKTREGRDAPNWIPGCMDEFEQKHLIKTPVETLRYLGYLYEEGRERIKGKSWNQELHFTIEEWQGCVDEWIEIVREKNERLDKNERQPEDKLVRQAVKAVRQIFNQFDKVGIQLDITLHSLTKDRSYLDGSLTDAADLYVFGSAISSRQNQFPADLDRNISKQRAETALALEIPQRAIVYRDATVSTWQVVVAPDLRAEFTFELEEPDHVQWLEQNKPEIERLFTTEKKSKTAIAEALKVPQVNSNQRWLALKEFVQSLEVA